jgi:hypothetical protein
VSDVFISFISIMNRINKFCEKYQYDCISVFFCVLHIYGKGEIKILELIGDCFIVKQLLKKIYYFNRCPALQLGNVTYCDM